MSDNYELHIPQELIDLVNEQSSIEARIQAAVLEERERCAWDAKNKAVFLRKYPGSSFASESAADALARFGEHLAVRAEPTDVTEEELSKVASPEVIAERLKKGQAWLDELKKPRAQKTAPVDTQSDAVKLATGELRKATDVCQCNGAICIQARKALELLEAIL